jgi:TatD DNase family protein
MPVRNPMIDSHAHIYLDAFDDDLEAVLGRSREAGVQRIYMPNIDSGSIGAMLREMGFYIGIGGVVTYKNSGLEDTLKETGIDRVLLETDSPYLSPVPHRGRRNEPANLVLISERIASITGLSTDAVAETTTHNSLTLFGDAR